MAAITSPDFPGERLIVCRNQALAAERARRREPLRGAAAIGLKVGAVLDQHKMAKHFTLDIADNRFGFARKTEEIAAEAALDGIYVVRTSLPATVLDDAATAQLQVLE